MKGTWANRAHLCMLSLGGSENRSSWVRQGHFLLVQNRPESQTFEALPFPALPVEAKSHGCRSRGGFHLREGTRRRPGRGGGGGRWELPRAAFASLAAAGRGPGPVPGKPPEPGGSDGKLLTSDGPARGLCQRNGEGPASSEDPCRRHSLH